MGGHPALQRLQRQQHPLWRCSFPNQNQNDEDSKENVVGYPSLAPSAPRCCTAISNCAVDLHLLSDAGLLDDQMIVGADGSTELPAEFHPRAVFSRPSLNDSMTCPKKVWVAVRNRLIGLFLESDRGGISPDHRLRDNASLRNQAFYPHLDTLSPPRRDWGIHRLLQKQGARHQCRHRVPRKGQCLAAQLAAVADHGRSSSVYPRLSGVDGEKAGRGVGSMSTLHRPCGQIQKDPADPSKGITYGPCRLMEFELEVAFFVGGPANSNGSANTTSNEHSGRPLTAEEAEERIFGYVLM